MLQSSVRSQHKDETASTSFTRQGSQRNASNVDKTLSNRSEEVNKLNKKFFQEYIITAEYQMLQSENIKGIYVIPSKESALLWFGVIFVRTGLYEDGVFRFNIYLPETFPDGEVPNVVFQSEVYHPVINQSTNELNLSKKIPIWKSGEQHIYHILRYVQEIFYNFQNVVTDSCISETIAEEYRNDVEKFKEKVRGCVKKSIDEIYDPPPVDDKHYLTFEPYIPAVHDSVRKSMLEEKNSSNMEQPMSRGLSWVAKDSFKPLSRPPSPDEDESES